MKHRGRLGVHSHQFGRYSVDISTSLGGFLKRGGFLKAADRDALARFPTQVDTDDLRRCFTLTPHDFAEVLDRRYGEGARMAAGIQIGALHLLGFVPDDLSTVPDAVLTFVGE